MSRVLGPVLTAPGVVVHELAHRLACSLVGVRVAEVAYFRLGDPAGYVRHEDPATYRAAFVISVAPFFVNTALSLALFAACWGLVSTVVPLEPSVGTLEALLTGEPELLAGAGVLAWLATGVGLHAFPSTGDASNLWQRTRRDWTGAPLVLLGLPFVFLIYVINLLSWAYAHLFYALGLGLGAFVLVSTIV